MIKFTPMKTHAEGSKSELFRLVMLKHLEFQKKYLNEDVQYPDFIPLEQYSMEASMNMDLFSDIDQHEVKCLKTLAGYKALLKEITASVTSKFEAKFKMDEAYLNALDEIVELNLVSNSVPFLQSMIADWNPSHFDINQFSQSLATLIVFKNPFIDLNDDKMIDSMANHYAEMLNHVNEYSFTPYVLKKIVNRIKGFKKISNINEELLGVVQKQNNIGHAVILNHIDFNLHFETLGSLFKLMNERFSFTQDPDRNILSLAMQETLESGVNPQDINTMIIRENIHLKIFDFLAEDQDILLNLIMAMQETNSRGCVGLLANIFAHQFLLKRNDNQSSIVELITFDTSFSMMEIWTSVLVEYLNTVERIYELSSINNQDTRSILMPFIKVLESLKTDGIPMPEIVIKEAIDVYLSNRISDEFYFESGSIS